MVARARFRHRKLVLLLSTLAAAAAGNAAAVPAGRVDFAIGGVTVTTADGRTRPVVKGLELASGDRVVTADGRAQIRFTDGAYVSLQPNSDFSIRDYRFDGKTDGTEKGVFGLVRGALRTVTGAIGRVNRGAYQIQTPTATIGIRGTGGLIQVLPDGSTLVTGNSGVWSLANRAGSVDVPAGKAAKAGPDQAIPPSESVEGPVVPPPGLLDVALLPTKSDTLTALPEWPSANRFIVGDQVTTTVSDATITFSNLTSALPPTALANQSVLFSPSGAVIQLGAYSLGEGGTIPESGNDGVLAWGRWTGSVNGIAGTFSPYQGFHYVVGLPAPSMPVSGVIPFSLLGATAPTLADGSEPAGALTIGQMTVDFGKGGVGLNLTTTFSSFQVNVQTNGATPNPAASEVSFPVGTPKFQGTITNPTQISGGGAFAACVSAGCTATIVGGFSGTGASHAGFTYQIASPTPGKVIHGAAAFKQ
jgi:hypothetical protein